MIPGQIEKLIRKSKVVFIATSDLTGRPNVAPKFLINVERNNIYLVDYFVNLTWKNIVQNPCVAISVFDDKSVTGYQLKGAAKIVSKGKEYENACAKLQQKIDDMSVDRVIDAVRSGRKSYGHEILIPAKIVIFKVIIKKINIISPTLDTVGDKIGKVKVSVENPVIETDLGTTTTPMLYPPILENLPESIEILSQKEHAGNR